MEHWIQSCRRELLDRTLIWNQAHLLHASASTNAITTRTARTANTRTLRPLPEPIADPDVPTHPNAHRHDRLDGLLHEYRNAA